MIEVLGLGEVRMGITLFPIYTNYGGRPRYPPSDHNYRGPGTPQDIKRGMVDYLPECPCIYIHICIYVRIYRTAR